MNRARVRSHARVDAAEAAAWYEKERPGLGVEFILELDFAIEKISDAPLAYATVVGPVRRVLVRRFPYAVYYAVVDDEIEVFAILHQSRASESWQTRGF